MNIEDFRKRPKYPIHPAKRLFDIIFSLIILSFLLPILCFIIIAIVLEHILRLRPRDPIFYSETRYSQGTQFNIYKFNIFSQEVIDTMRSKGEFIDTKKLERNGFMTFVGKILKQIYLDEIPQFFNILIGDMSVVGPRPVNLLSHEKLLMHGTIEKTLVKAGLTGYYQFHHKHGKEITQEVADKIYVDFYFQNNWYKILRFDVAILFKTLKVLVEARGI